MPWNYRIILHDCDADTNKHWFGLHEVYYDGADARSWTEDAISFMANIEEGAEGITLSLEMALSDAKKHPMLHESELIKAKE